MFEERRNFEEDNEYADSSEEAEEGCKVTKVAIKSREVRMDKEVDD